MYQLTMEVIMMLKLTDNIREEINSRSEGKNYMTEMVNASSFEINMI